MKSINLQRTESLLMELIPQALSQLQNSKINSLPITGVNCKNGKYDAIVYFDCNDFNKDEGKEVIESLKKANRRIKNNVKENTGRYKCPNFKIKLDKYLEKSKNKKKKKKKIKKN